MKAEPERRNSQRHSVTVGIRWRVQGQWARRLQRATMVDLSLRGAGIRARHDDAFSIGTFVDIIVGRGRGVVEIRRIDRSTEPPFAYYAVQFFELDAPLMDLVLDLTRMAETD
ncbi:MAG: PilZ domain-containing protein [Acidimicrobiales bacterium]